MGYPSKANQRFSNREPRTANREPSTASRLFFLIMMGAVATAAEPAWDWLPRAADDDRVCEIHLAAPDGWTATPVDGLEASRADGQMVLRFEPRQVPTVEVRGPQERSLAIRLLEPGTGADLSVDADGRLHCAAAAAVLAVPRREAAADRRWSVLRAVGAAKIETCAHVLAEPAQAPLGVPALTRQIAEAQALDPHGSRVLVRLSGDDRFAAWKHREYRQALAWLVADLAARGATHVVLVEPTCPQVDEPLLSPLRAQVRDVARAYRCTAVDTTALGDHACWEVSPGLLGRAFNAVGEERYRRLVAGWLPVDGGH